MFPNPNTLAPSSHSAQLPTHPPPLSSVQRPDVRSMNIANWPSLLHVLSAAMQNIPVELALSQSADPHAQLVSSLAEVPSVILQDS